VIKLSKFVEFMCGAESYDEAGDVWFADNHPDIRGKFWWRKELREHIASLEATIRENTAQAALIINPPLIEQPSHEDFILWLSSYRDEFIAKSEHVELLEAQLKKLQGERQKWINLGKN